MGGANWIDISIMESEPSSASTGVERLHIGVLCIQGAFIEHIQILKRVSTEKSLELDIVDVRKPDQLADLDGLIIPGGESTTLSVFLSKNSFNASLKAWMCDADAPRVLWGTCAGLILIANKLTEQKEGGQVTVGGLDVECSRNIYGRQQQSFEAPVTLHSSLLAGNSTHTCPGVFLRAPGISKVTSPEVEVLGTLEPEGTVVAVQQGNLIATTFHPELTSDTRWHGYFIQQVLQHKRRRLQ